MPSRDDLSGVFRQQDAARQHVINLALANVAAALVSGLLKPGEHTVDDAIAMYRETFGKLREDNGGL